MAERNVLEVTNLRAYYQMNYFGVQREVRAVEVYRTPASAPSEFQRPFMRDCPVVLIWTDFGFGFGNGLWGLLEIAVFGLLSLVGLRIACEALLVWFKAHEQSGETVNRSRYSASLLDEVRDAIRDLAEEGEDPDYAEADEYITPATEPAPYVPPATPAESVTTPRSPATASGETHKAPRRTARRTPPPKNVS